MLPNTHIIVQKGGSLVVNNAKIDCCDPNDFWDGIILYGDKYNHGDGTVYINNSIITHANAGVWIGHDDGSYSQSSDNIGGGLLSCINSKFIDNRSYAINAITNAADFNRPYIYCNNIEFITTKTLRTVGSNNYCQEAFVWLNGVLNANFYSCSMDNATNWGYTGSNWVVPSPLGIVKGRGMVATNSKVSWTKEVQAYPSTGQDSRCVTYNTQPNKAIKSLYKAFEINMDASFFRSSYCTIDIEFNDFLNNEYDIEQTNTIHSLVKNNSFITNNSFLPFFHFDNTYFEVRPGNYISVNYTNCSKIDFSENIMKRNWSYFIANQESNFLGAQGLRILGSGITPSQVYNNTFENKVDFTVSCSNPAIHASVMLYDNCKGLNLLCNKFNNLGNYACSVCERNTMFDIYCEGANTNFDFKDQGNSGVSSGNTFTDFTQFPSQCADPADYHLGGRSNNINATVTACNSTNITTPCITFWFYNSNEIPDCYDNHTTPTPTYYFYHKLATSQNQCASYCGHFLDYSIVQDGGGGMFISKQKPPTDENKIEINAAELVTGKYQISVTYPKDNLSSNTNSLENTQYNVISIEGKPIATGLRIINGIIDLSSYPKGIYIVNLVQFNKILKLRN